MSNSAQVLAIITTLGALVLAVSAVRSHRLPIANYLRMGLIWASIIVGLVIILKVLGA